jgi:hypothetical protein
MRGRSRQHANNHKIPKAHNRNTRQIGRQHDRCIEGEKRSGETAATAAPCSLSSCHASNCFGFQVRSANSSRGTRVFERSNFDTSKLHS